MGEVIPFRREELEEPKDASQYEQIWTCDCGCSFFQVLPGGAVRCNDCLTVQKGF